MTPPWPSCHVDTSRGINVCETGFRSTSHRHALSAVRLSGTNSAITHPVSFDRLRGRISSPLRIRSLSEALCLLNALNAALPPTQA